MEQGAMVDQLVKIDSAEGLKDAAMQGVQVVVDGKPWVELDGAAETTEPSGKGRREGVWTGAERRSLFPFTEMIPSWNLLAPAGTGVRFFVRVRDAESREWSPWLYVGYWGAPVPADPKTVFTTQFAGGQVEIDTVALSRPADAWQLQAKLESSAANRATTPRIRRMSVVYSGRVSDPAVLQKLPPSAPTSAPTSAPISAPISTAHSATAHASSPAAAQLDLAVPYRAQGDAPEEMRSHVCSATSVTMVMAFWGKDIPIVDNCRAIWDDEYKLFGNWNRAVARAGEMGFDAWVTHFRNWRQVRAALAAGQPIIASIRFKAGEFPSSVLQSSEGHLIVIRGMTADGDLICNDPGNRERGCRAIYKADELAKAWFGRGGVAYVIQGAAVRDPPTAR